jgi:pSer/pThr/pTyr-binding forkhead associated (FHA) protein
MPDEKRANGQAGPQTPVDYVEVLSGPEDGRVFPLREPTATVGRNPGNTICVPLELSVSRRHAVLTKVGEEYELEIFSEARNAGRVRGGTLLPGERAILRKGESFHLGDVEFELGPSC